MNTTDMNTSHVIVDERTDLLELLRTRRAFLRFTANGLTDEQAASHPTASELCVGGLIKHVSDTEAGWARFIVEGPSALAGDKDWTEWGEAEWAARVAGFQMLPGERLAAFARDLRRSRAADRRAGRHTAGSRCRATAAEGAVVRTGRPPFGPSGVYAHRRRDRPARRPRRHHPRDDRRPENHVTNGGMDEWYRL